MGQPYVGTSKTKPYAGTSKVKAIYRGTTKIWSASVPAGQAIFTTSQVWTVPEGVSTIDIFCVGGGSGGENNGNVQNKYPSGGRGGSGGFTKTAKQVSVTPGQQLVVTIGAGGAILSSPDRSGGATSVGGLCSADGGIIYWFSITEGTITYLQGKGGSGGGSSAGYGTIQPGYPRAGDGGSDGSNGFYYGTTPITNSGQAGQGTTTKAFGEPNGTVYAGGAGGGGCEYIDIYGDSHKGITGYHGAGGQAPNTGGGGYGSMRSYRASSETTTVVEAATIGFSGIAIIRWAEQ